jgi:hypothetical protein
VDCLSETLCVEKGLHADRVALHPEDPLTLLMWGAFDDLTPIEFRYRLDDEFGQGFGRRTMEFVASSYPDWDKLSSRLTLRELINHCATCLPVQTSAD